MKRENREIDSSLLRCFPLLQMVFPAVCDIGVEHSVADCPNALSKAEQKRARERKYHQKKMTSINPERREPKGINLRAGEDEGRCTAPRKANP